MAIEHCDIVFIALVTFCSCFQLGSFADRVGKIRRKYRIEPPEIDGPPEFLRTFRAQQNNLEFFPMFIGVLWVSGIFFHQVPAALLGLYYMYLREQYFVSYARDAKQRRKPFHQSVKVLKAFAVMCVLGLGHCISAHHLGFNVVRTARWYYRAHFGYTGW